MKKLLLISLLFLYPFLSKGQETVSFCNVEIYKYNYSTHKFYFSQATSSVGYMYSNENEIKIYVDGELYFYYLKSDLKLITNKTEDGVQVIVLRHISDPNVFIQATKKWVAIGKDNDYKIILNTCN